MNLDTASVLAVSIVVVNLSGMLFVLETILRRDEGAGRVWAIAWIALMLMTLSYLLWTQTHTTWWAIAVGNGSLVCSSGLLWIGCRVFNGHRLMWASLVVAAGTILTMLTALIGGVEAGEWAGAEWMFALLVVFAGLGAVECLRGTLLGARSAWVLAAALGGYGLYYLSRLTAFLTTGPDGALFTTGFGAIPTSLVTVGYVIVVVVLTSVLRATRAPMRGAATTVSGGVEDDVLAEGDFERALGALVSRAQRRGEIVGVIGVRADDLEQISTAFGSEQARVVAGVLRQGVRRHAPSTAFVGIDGPSAVTVGIVVPSAGEARRQAAAIYRGLFDDLGAVGTGVIPVLGVGVGLSDTAGYDAAALIELARETAGRAALNIETSVLVADAG